MTSQFRKEFSKEFSTLLSLLESLHIIMDLEHKTDSGWRSADILYKEIWKTMEMVYRAAYDAMTNDTTPVCMWSQPKTGYTTVEFEDGDKVTVHDELGDGTEFGGFCAAFAKKCFGSTTNVIRSMNDCLNEAEWRNKSKKEHHKKNGSQKRQLCK